MANIDRQWLFFDRTDICTGTSRYYFDESRMTPEGRKQAESLYNKWNFCMEIGQRHGLRPLRVPHGLQFVTEPPVITRPLFSLDEPWENTGAQLGYLSGCFDDRDGLYKVWYSMGDHTFLAQSPDLKSWTKPLRSDWEYDGKPTNAINIEVSEGSVFLDPLHPETGRYKAVCLTDLDDDSQQERMGLVLYSSDDGIRFTRMDTKPLRYFFDTQNNIFFDEELYCYVGYLRGHYNGRAIQRTESKSLDDMPMPSLLFFPDNDDPLDADYYNNGCTPYLYDKRYRILLCSVYRHGADQMELRMAHSRNGRDFQWTSRLPLSDGTDEDGTKLTNYYASPHMVPLIRNGRPAVGVFLRSSGSLHNEGYFHTLYGRYKEKHRGVRMAVWEKDRLAGLRAEACGEFWLQLRLTPKQTIEVNARLKGQGELCCELVTQREDEPLQGFAMNDAIPLGGDVDWQRLCWAGDPELPQDIGDRDIFLHVKLQQGTIYGVRLVSE